jgi:hypothetical protein
MKLNWKKWLYAMVATVIGGAANSIVAMIVDPKAFNLQDLPKLGQFAIGAAIISFVLYLQKAPVPPLEEDEAAKPGNPS